MRECDVPGCEKPASGRRICDMHHQRRKMGVPDDARCARCDHPNIQSGLTDNLGNRYCSNACHDIFTYEWYSRFLREHGRGPLLAGAEEKREAA